MKTIALCSMLSLNVLMAAPPSFEQTVRRCADMTRDADLQARAQKLGLNVLSLTWEDTGRFENSSVGPNISDMTIQVALKKEKGVETLCMPVIRTPNFSDKTGDISPEKFHLLVGNEKGQELRSITLKEFLENPTLYLHDAGSWSGDKRRSLYAPKRDSKVLVSAQACFLPIPQEGKVDFNPVLFNYQSVKGDPAVLTLLVTREGTSATVIDNVRDAFSEGNAWGQRLFFNKNGQRASLQGQRESDFKAEQAAQGTAGVAEQPNLNQVLLIQIPLKQRRPRREQDMLLAVGSAMPMVAEAMPMADPESDVENAVIGHGELEGPFTEIDALPIERDTRFPVRVTVQYYKATSNGVVSDKDLKDIHQSIESVYAQADAVGSLVTDGPTGRITEYDGPKQQPEGWWEAFWIRHEQNTGDSRKEAMRKLKKLLGKDYQDLPVNDVYLNRLLNSYSTDNK